MGSVLPAEYVVRTSSDVLGSNMRYNLQGIHTVASVSRTRLAGMIQVHPRLFKAFILLVGTVSRS